MRKINLSISGCMGRMGQQLIKSSKKNRNFKLVSLTENRFINKKIAGIKPLKNSVDAFKRSNVIIDFTIPKCTLEILKIASKLKIHQIDRKLFDTIVSKILGYYWDLRKPVNYEIDMEFQRIESKDKGILNKGIIHVDSQHSICAGLIYLNRDAPRDTGTSFYKLKDSSYKISPRTLLEPIAKYHAGEDVDAETRYVTRNQSLGDIETKDEWYRIDPFTGKGYVIYNKQGGEYFPPFYDNDFSLQDKDQRYHQN